MVVGFTVVRFFDVDVDFFVVFLAVVTFFFVAVVFLVVIASVVVVVVVSASVDTVVVTMSICVVGSKKFVPHAVQVNIIKVNTIINTDFINISLFSLLLRIF